MKTTTITTLLLAVFVFHSPPGPVQAATEGYHAVRPPGMMINLGMHRMYIDCRGFGQPTVLIDVGLADASVNWLPVMASVQHETRICLYDRAGYGWSDPGPGERTTAQITYELHALLELANVPPPYVLVGHSFGGFTARYFATKYPDETVGVVLVESSHPDQVQRLAELDKLPDEKRRITIGRNSNPPDYLTDMEKKWFFLNSSRKAIFAQMDELKYFSGSAEQVKTAGPFPDIPLAVITRGVTQLPAIDGKSLEDEWRSMQADLTRLSRQSWQTIVDGSGHNVYLDKPSAVVEDIIKVVILARQNMLEHRKFSYHNAAQERQQNLKK